MRTTFIQTLTEAAAKDPRITLVVGDLGFGVVTDFAKRFPKQYLNAGVAEQNMTGVAAGLALGGKIAVTYSIANFPTLRCLEQIRNDACYPKANVVVVAVGGGYSYGSLGMTHHATEDLAIMRALPELTVIAPGDPVETREATLAAVSGIGPVYLRLGRDKEPVVHQSPIDWKLGKAITVREGTDITLISTGAMLPTTVAVADMLADREISAQVLSMHTIKPLDADAVIAAAHQTGRIAAIEEHSILGGLGGSVAEVLCEAGVPNVRFLRVGLPSKFIKDVGDQDYLRKMQGMDPCSILERLQTLF